jgi:biotin carboxyl carrier protein
MAHTHLANEKQLMHYAIVLGELEREIEIVEVSPGRYEVEMEGRRYHLDARSITDTTLSLLVDNEAYTIEFEDRADSGYNLLVRGHILHTDVLDLRQMRLRNATVEGGTFDGPAEIVSPMPGKVVSVLVKEGDEVQEGQGLVVVEAMKMENELKAPKAGVVRHLVAEEGVAVDSGVALCTIE